MSGHGEALGAPAAGAESATLHGIGVSPGSAYGPVVQAAAPVAPPEDEPAAEDPAAASEQAIASFMHVADTLDQKALSADPTARDILKATAMIARDRSLHREVTKRLNAGKGPAGAVAEAIEVFAAQFEALGGYFAERVTDLRDVGARAIAEVLGKPAPGLPTLTEPSIVAAEDLAPAETATLDRSLVLGIVTRAGGLTSHTAILAAQMGIPAVVQLPEATAIPMGTPLLIDGGSGEVVVRPDPESVEAQRQRRERRAAALAEVSGPGATSDGHRVAVLANIGGVDDAELAGAEDVEGVGLFRTEFVFLSAVSAPSVEEQTEIYRKVFAPFAGRRVVVRTLDAGADKPLAFADLGPEENPALGRRGLRLSQARPDVLTAQLEALAAAAEATGADVRVMAPMVSTAAEARWFADQVRANGLASAGVMIEVPAAALRARQVLQAVDFGSLGTNDLAQYTMAADRMEGELSELLDPWQPAVLSMIAAAADGAKAAGKPLGVCGESAGDPLLALVLVGLGITSLSMAPGKVGAVRLALRSHAFDDCRALAEAALAAESPEEAREAVRAGAAPELLDLL
ncbi:MULTISPECIES: phosphoenolpyruvate--protein phosphotransferase [Brevibacterium]|uniref:Phosphoenolpyruvate-protein phosphotransferase n=8 Tax=Bacteria TaxID=2 RepID=K9ACX8_9MICO|nr:phosphoenolpyruvate--protein phosphotransferase [Brevibacterium casei]NJE67401.1 phosphoenolpyruvate--protein phosphotransferase [Brevibacterium sp. LS14]EKU45184.1 phosphoenolpyruvate--protein phosphotransferase [Brevibacterium casei S18]KZE12329.1 phosphoenolpyruvate--protein phosphotransferase [Brevibacterium casei]MCT1446041.1 phosphoenolpyruvate--protein phosphotransferase [Brevibacterium casei]MCT1764513.1 phosphoenolpyruvate--protein phosphotransferase [Brevibacterium casei]